MKTTFNFFKRIHWNKSVIALIICLLFLVSFSCQKNEFDRGYLPDMDARLHVAACKQATPKQGRVVDVERNIYKTVKIGDQWWMAENLKTTKFNDGTPINLADENSEWISFGSSATSAYCWYGDAPTNKDIYGALYNGYAVKSGKLCPVGWRIPSDIERDRLITFLGGPIVAGSALKEAANSHWINYNSDATNSSGFTALPGGYRDINEGNFVSGGYAGFWWTSTAAYDTYLYDFYIYSEFTDAYSGAGPNGDGFSVRCVKEKVKHNRH